MKIPKEMENALMLARTTVKCLSALVADLLDGAVEVLLEAEGVEAEAVGVETTKDDSRLGGTLHRLEKDAIPLLFPLTWPCEIEALIL